MVNQKKSKKEVLRGPDDKPLLMDMITGGDYYQREGEEQGEVQMKQQYYDDQSTTICR